LNLKDCAALRSLQPLSASQNLSKINLEGCAKLKSLEGLAATKLEPWRHGIFSFEGCTELVNLRGLSALSNEIKTLYLQQMPSLVSLEGIEAASSLETLDIENTALTNLRGIEHLLSLEDLTLNDCNQLQDISELGQLHALKHVHSYDCSQLKLLPSTWGPMLRRLEFNAGNFSALGELPEVLEEIEVRGVATLLNLKGLEKSTSLTVVAVDPFLKDATAMQGLPNAYFRCFEATANPVTPAWLQSVA